MIGVFVRLVALCLIVYCALAVLDSDKKPSSLQSRLQQHLALHTTLPKSNTHVHKGGVVIIDMDTELYYPMSLSAKNILSIFTLSTSIYAKKSSEAKTIAFISRLTEPVARYYGGISISGTRDSNDPLYLLHQNNGKSINVVKENIEVVIVDVETRSIINRTIIEGSSPGLLADKISEFKKMGENSYVLLMSEGRTSNTTWHVVYCKKTPCGVAVGEYSAYDTAIREFLESTQGAGK
ncbi:MAG: hypothetical protein FD156_1141 [Nitrospirae bacterium]|nr:MAG: hypothetical protein FD156_1141 [Nitrospirota bacterium]